VTIAPPQPPATPPRPDDPEELDALVKEARQRARRRRLLMGSALAVLVAAAVFGSGVVHVGRSAPAAASSRPPVAGPGHALPRNGLLAVDMDGGWGNDGWLGVVRPDGSGLRRLVHCDCGLAGFAWSPNGRQLAFMGGHLGGALTGSKLWLYVVNADGSGRQRLTLCGACETHANIAWSPDSRRIAFATRTRLDVFDLGSGAERVLTRHIPGDASLAWSPDGTTIAFGDGSRVSTIRPDGSQQRTFADVADWVGDVSWSPDGRSILFDAGDRIYTIGADGSNLRQLVSGPPNGGPDEPAWSPDGRRIVFLSSPLGYSRVLVMRSDGSDQRIIYRAGNADVGSPPIWSPDGKQIAINLNGVVVMDLNGKHRHRTFRITTLAVWQPLPRTP
jgi:Tol biopolymer transport system component